MPILLLALMAAPTPSAAVPETWFSAFLIASSNDPYFEPVDLVRRPDRHQVASLLPQTARVSYRANVICEVQDNGSVHSCKPQQLWPDDKSTFRLASKLLPSIRLSLADAEAAKAHHAELLVTMYIDDEDRKLDRSCPPGWCPILPAPPPAPSVPSE